MPRVLVMDLGKRTGWAADSDTVGRPVWGTVDLSGGKEEYEVAGADLARWLHIAIDLHQPEYVAFERPLDPRNMGDREQGRRDDEGARIGARPRFFTSYESIRIVHGLAMVAGVVALKDGIARDKLKEVHVQSWRGRFIGGYPRKQPDGSRSDPKKITVARCYQLGWRLKDDNAGDACGVWAFMKSELEPGFLYDNGTSPFLPKKTKARAA